MFSSEDEALRRLKKILGVFDSVLVAFSGGVDSTLLLGVAHQVLGERAQAVTFASLLLPRREMQRAVAFCQQQGIRQTIAEVNPLELAEIRTNGPERCYHCKLFLYCRGLELAARLGISHLIDGSQLSDVSAQRPGHQALKELGIRSPLAEAELDKEQVRRLSRKLGLASWNLPPMACLATRIPQGTPLEAEALARVEAAEEFLFDQGFQQVRIRDDRQRARIEVDPDELGRFSDPELRRRLLSHFKALGYVSVVVDLEGYHG